MMTTNYVEYTSNNSGGQWPLDDSAWHCLEDAGWKVEWFKDNPRYEDGRWLEALARNATRHNMTLREAVTEFEMLTGLDATEAGCPCCGPPHSFTEYDSDDEFVASGPSVSYTCEF